MKQAGHTYLRTHRVKGDVLSFVPRDQATEIEQSAAYRRSGRTAKTLVHDGPFRVEVIVLRASKSMAEHHVNAYVTIHVLRGALRVTTTRGPADLGAGSLLVLEPNTAHSVTARRDARFLLTIALQR